LRYRATTFEKTIVMVKKITLFILSFVCLAVQAQQWEWDSIISSTYSPVVVKNHTNEVFTFEFHGSELKKYNSTGKFIWAKSFNGSLYNVSFDLTDNIYITGIFSNSLTVDSVTLSSKGDDDIFILKLTPSQNMVWLHQIGSIGKDGAGDISIKENKIYVTGATLDTSLFDQFLFPKKTCLDMFIARYDMNANLEKVKFAEQPIPDPYNGSIGCEIKNDALGNVIVLAAINGQIKIDTTIINAGYSYYIVKFDTALNLLWNRQATIGLGCGAKCLRVNSIGDVLLTANYSGHYFQSGYVRRISFNGDTMQTFFTESMGFVYGLDLDSLDNIYFTGIEHTWSYSGNPPYEYYFKTGKLNSTGNLIWLLQDSSLSYREGFSIASLSNNSLFISGRFAGKIVLYDTLFGMSGVNCFLAILNMNSTTGTVELSSDENNLEIFPNPSSGIFTINLHNCRDVKICVYDVLGNCLLNKVYVNDVSPMINLSNQPKGIYFLEIVSYPSTQGFEGQSGERVVKKIVLQ